MNFYIFLGYFKENILFQLEYTQQSMFWTCTSIYEYVYTCHKHIFKSTMLIFNDFPYNNYKTIQCIELYREGKA